VAEAVYMVWRADRRFQWMLDGMKSSFEAALIAANRIMAYTHGRPVGAWPGVTREIKRKWRLYQELFPPIAGGSPCKLVAGWELDEVSESADWHHTHYVAVVASSVEHDVLDVLAFNG